jgi:excisionase family DNA binding protein
MTLAQAAELSACSTKTLRRAIDAGRLKACRLGQGAKSDRIHPADLDAWWAASRLEPLQFPAFPYARLAPPIDTVDERLDRLLSPSQRKKKPLSKQKARSNR